MLSFRLQIFHAVAINLSFTKAAEELYITQPAVTSNIKELEKELNITLFDRNPNGITITKAGKLLLEHTQRLFALEKKFQYDLSLLKDTFSGQLNLGTSTTIGQYIVPPVLAEFHKRYPEIALSLSNHNTQYIEDLVLDHTLDLGIIEGNSKRKGLKYIPFMKDEIVAIAHTSQKISIQDNITVQELQNTPLVLRERGSGTLEVISEKLMSKKVKMKNLNIEMYLGSTESIKTYLTNSNSLGLISINAVSKEIGHGEFKVIDIEDFEMTRDFNFIYPQGVSNGFADLFMQYVIKYYNK